MKKTVITPKPESWPWIWTYKRHPDGQKLTFEESDLSLCYIRPKELFPLKRIEKFYPKVQTEKEYTTIEGDEVIIEKRLLPHSQPQPEYRNVPPQDGDHTREVILTTCLNQARMDIGFHPFQVEPGLLRTARWTVHTQTLPEFNGIENYTYEMRPIAGDLINLLSDFVTPVVDEDNYPDNFPTYDWRNFFCLNSGKNQNNFWTPDFYNERCKFFVPEKITHRFQKISYETVKTFYMRMHDFYKGEIGGVGGGGYFIPFHYFRYPPPMFIGISASIANKRIWDNEDPNMRKHLLLQSSSIVGNCRRSNPTGINEDYLLHKVYNLYPEAPRKQRELNVHKFNSWVIASTLNKPLDWKPTIEEWLEFEKNGPSYPQLEFLINNGFFNLKIIHKRAPNRGEVSTPYYEPATIIVEEE